MCGTVSCLSGSGVHTLKSRVGVLCAVQMAVFYFFSPRVTRSIMYGTAARNRLDIYRPPADQQAPDKGFPVVIYLTGEPLDTLRLGL